MTIKTKAEVWVNLYCPSAVLSVSVMRINNPGKYNMNYVNKYVIIGKGLSGRPFNTTEEAWEDAVNQVRSNLSLIDKSEIVELQERLSKLLEDRDLLLKVQNQLREIYGKEIIISEEEKEVIRNYTGECLYLTELHGTAHQYNDEESLLWGINKWGQYTDYPDGRKLDDRIFMCKNGVLSEMTISQKLVIKKADDE